MRRSRRIWEARIECRTFRHDEPQRRRERDLRHCCVSAPPCEDDLSMSDVTPTRAAALELKDERRAMREGYVFLDEKCLLLAGEILRELGRYAMLSEALS